MRILKSVSPEEEARLLPERPILVGYRGSIAHGMYVPPTEATGLDDIDLMCVYIPGIEHYFGHGLGFAKGKHIYIREWDCAAYELRKFAGLLANANPNVLSMLWLDDDKYLHISAEGKALIEARDLFSSRRAHASFCGYAMSQLKRMTSVKDVEPECDCAGEYHEPNCALTVTRGRGSSKRFATGFMGRKRKELVKKFGFDTKNAAHLIRLLRMGADFLETGHLLVDRSKIDADQLLAIKRGEVALDDVKRLADAEFVNLHAARDESPLPAHPNMEAIDALLVRLLTRAHFGQYNVRTLLRFMTKGSEN